MMGREDDHLSGPSFRRDSMGGEPLFYQDLTTFDANRSTAYGACLSPSRWQPLRVAGGAIAATVLTVSTRTFNSI